MHFWLNVLFSTSFETCSSHKLYYCHKRTSSIKGMIVPQGRLQENVNYLFVVLLQQSGGQMCRSTQLILKKQMATLTGRRHTTIRVNVCVYLRIINPLHGLVQLCAVVGDGCCVLLKHSQQRAGLQIENRKRHKANVQQFERLFLQQQKQKHRLCKSTPSPDCYLSLKWTRGVPSPVIFS